ncbi:hypothetical protein LTSEINV_5703 [Salmonella enterica subsp. enterica serovar Inverness str. R8-3668]|uniref:Uncharacterized protein n=1 Tax=Salmonella enterica subsp. enterica serovar Inverness str. R8-3668 TaxID=913075 RepID=G5NKN2_SALET|nr:hypothetical protein LTSEINV_5703 [Salmonella enterica subsp. enterica serovar Inverness str. R8-3668]
MPDSMMFDSLFFSICPQVSLRFFSICPQVSPGFPAGEPY